MTRLLPPPRLLLAALLCAGLLLAIAAPLAPAAAKSGVRLPVKKVRALIELRHPGGLDRFVRSVSDPASPRYRHYASVEKLVARYGAKPKTRKRVLGWLRERGLRGTVTADGSFVLVSLGPSQAARLMPRAADARPGTAAARTGRQVPPALGGAVKRISLLGTAPAARALAPPGAAAAAKAKAGGKKHRHPFFSIRKNEGTPSGCAAGDSAVVFPGYRPFTPNQYLTAYGHAAMHAKGLKGQGQTVAVVEAGGFKRSDIVTFAHCFGIGKPPPTKVVPVGELKPLPGEPETTLDLSMLTVGAPKLKRIYVYEGGDSDKSILETAGAALGSPGHRPDVISISLGFCEPQTPNAIAVRNAIDGIFAVAAGAGISVLVSAGDQGSSGCRVENLESGKPTALPTLAVSLPASSAYVTAVGGTALRLSRKNRIKSQIVWNDWPQIPWGGGGGSSLLYSRTPWWQGAGRRYGIGRKVPDIAALADIIPGYALYCSAAACEPEEDPVRGWGAVGGTSAAAPLMAAGVALANQYAERRGQRTLGFLNPLLYRLGAGARPGRAPSSTSSTATTTSAGRCRRRPRARSRSVAASRAADTTAPAAGAR